MGFNSATVFFGQNFLSVRNEFFSAEWHGQFGSAGIFAMACATIFFAVSALRCRLAMIDFERDVFLVRFPAIVVGRHRHRRVGDLGFARAFGLAEIRHADDVVTGSMVRQRFGARAERRAFHADISAAVVNRRARLRARFAKRFAAVPRKSDRRTRRARRCRARKMCG